MAFPASLVFVSFLMDSGKYVTEKVEGVEQVKFCGFNPGKAVFKVDERV